MMKPELRKVSIRGKEKSRACAMRSILASSDHFYGNHGDSTRVQIVCSTALSEVIFRNRPALLHSNE